MPLFVVLLTRAADGPLELLPEWPAHAAFMDGLAERGTVLAGGPLEDTRHTILIVAAVNAAQVENALAADPWRKAGLIETSWIRRWTLRLGTIF